MGTITEDRVFVVAGESNSFPFEYFYTIATLRHEIDKTKFHDRFAWSGLTADELEAVRSARGPVLIVGRATLSELGVPTPSRALAWTAFGDRVFAFIPDPSEEPEWFSNPYHVAALQLFLEDLTAS